MQDETGPSSALRELGTAGSEYRFHPKQPSALLKSCAKDACHDHQV